MSSFLLMFAIRISVVMSLCLGHADAITFEKAQLLVGAKTIEVEVARTDAQRAQGLMHRTSLSKNSGMLFLFETEETRRFWMKNTRIPLSIAFIDGKQKIIDIQDMQPESEMSVNPKIYASNRPALWALEMNLGWFRENGLKTGDRVQKLNSVTPPRSSP